MLDPFTMMAIAQGVPALLQAGTGIGQFITGRKMLKDLERPEYEIPQAAKAALGQATSLASSQEMAGMSWAEKMMNQQLAMGVEAAQQTAGSSAEALGAITNMFANRMAQQGGLAGQAAQDYAMRQAARTQQLANMAAQQEKAQAYNVLQPYDEETAAASAMGGAGMQNIMGGLQGLGGGIAGVYAQKAQLEQLEKMLGMGQQIPAGGTKTMTTTPDLGSTFVGASQMTPTGGSGLGSMYAQDRTTQELNAATTLSPEIMRALEAFLKVKGIGR